MPHDVSEIDDELEKDEVSFVKISEEGSEEQFGILELPALAFIQNGIPNIYEGDLVIEKACLRLGWTYRQLHQRHFTRPIFFCTKF